MADINGTIMDERDTTSAAGVVTPQDEEQEVDEVMGGWTVKPHGFKEAFADEGYHKIAQLTKELGSIDIRCCLVDTEAMHYYGGPFLLQNFQICVSSATFDKAIEWLLQSSPLAEELNQVPSIDIHPSWDTNPRNPVERFAKFEHKTHVLTIYVVPAATICMESVFDRPDVHLVFEPNKGVFFPALKNIVQASLDFPHLENLEDLVDAMDLTDEWAEQVGINFDDAPDEKICNGLPMDRGKMWRVTVEGKKSRIPWKVDPRDYATRFRKIGHEDMTMKIKCAGFS